MKHTFLSSLIQDKHNSINSISRILVTKTLGLLFPCYRSSQRTALSVNWASTNSLHNDIIINNCEEKMITHTADQINVDTSMISKKVWHYKPLQKTRTCYDTNRTSLPLAWLPLDLLPFSVFGMICLSKYFLNFSIKYGLTLAWTLLCPIPLIKSGSALYGSITVSSSLSEWLKGTIESLVPWMSSTGLRMEGAKSTLGNLSPGRVQPLSMTIR